MYVCKAIFGVLIVCLPMIFAIDGLGLNTWQWWALSVGLIASNIVGYIEGLNDNKQLMFIYIDKSGVYANNNKHYKTK